MKYDVYFKKPSTVSIYLAGVGSNDGHNYVGSFTADTDETLTINGDHIFVVKAKEVIANVYPGIKLNHLQFLDRASNSPVLPEYSLFDEPNETEPEFVGYAQAITEPPVEAPTEPTQDVDESQVEFIPEQEEIVQEELTEESDANTDTAVEETPTEEITEDEVVETEEVVEETETESEPTPRKRKAKSSTED